MATALVPVSREASPLSDPSTWQVVLVDPRRHVVLYNRTQNSFTVHSTRRTNRGNAVGYLTDTSSSIHSDEDDDDDEIFFNDAVDDDEIEEITTERADERTLRGRAPHAANQRRVRANIAGTLGSSASTTTCPLCGHVSVKRNLRKSRHVSAMSSDNDSSSAAGSGVGTPTQQHRSLPLVANQKHYFNLLSEASSRANTPTTTRSSSRRQRRFSQHGSGSDHDIDEDEDHIREPDTTLDSKTTLNTGYYATFFQEVRLLGRGGAGSVHHVVHVLNGEKLGTFAVKKVAVGDSSHSLLRILREVHLLESLNHPNIVTYHHAWVEHSQLSTYAPSVPTLHILMEYANGGSLDAFIDARRGGASLETDDAALSSRQRKERHRLRKLGAVHLLRLDEILTLFEDITTGLAFLHARNILHLDLKAENVLLHWEEDDLLPTAKLSDFGNATNDAFHRERTGGSGTLAYTAPEAWEIDVKTARLHSPDRAADQWALGLILHLLSFFTLPYREEHDMAVLETEIRAYPGFLPSDASHLAHGTRHDLPPALLRLIARLVHRRPVERLPCDKVLIALKHICEQSTSKEGISTEMTALVRSPSPPDIVPLTAASVTGPPLIASKPASVAAVPALPRQAAANMSQNSLRIRQLYAALASVIKLALMQRICQPSFLRVVTLYMVMLSGIADVAYASPIFTLELLAVQLGFVWFLGGQNICI